jgi:FAD/FMN-containing dehydrogenase
MPDFLAESMDQGLIEDATIAQNDAQRQQFWHLRESLPEAQNHVGGSIKHDISVPISEISNFLKAAEDAVLKIVPGCRPVPFGHIGDGNIHYNITQPEQMDKQEFLSFWAPMNRAIYDVVKAHNGSISAEHGIGQMKRDYMPEIKSKVELDMMAGIKRLLDPEGILNPGKLLPPEER